MASVCYDNRSLILFFCERRRGVSKKTKKNTEEKKTQKEKRKRKEKRGPSGIPELRRRARPLALPGAAVRDRCRLAERRRSALRAAALRGPGALGRGRNGETGLFLWASYDSGVFFRDDLLQGYPSYVFCPSNIPTYLSWCVEFSLCPFFLRTISF